MAHELVVMGGGNMGAALLDGMLSSGSFEASTLAVVEPSAERRVLLAARFPGVAVGDAAVAAAAAVIAVKPPDVPEVAAAAARAGARRLLSIAAGVSTATIEDAVGEGVAVVRSMPNTPSLVGLGVAAIAAGRSAGDADLDWADRILSAVGTCVRLDEEHFDAVTALTGSGPAYVFLLAEALVDAGVANGLPRELVEQMVAQLLVGSSALLARDGDPVALRAMVTSPGGTTAAGVAALDAHDVRGAVAAAVAAAAARSRELGGR